MLDLIFWLPPVAIFIALFMMLRPSQNRQTSAHPLGYETQQAEMDIPSKDIQMPQLITIYLIPQDGDRFQGYELLQSFSSQGFTFGEFQLFHYLVDGQPLFSISQASAPGTFNLDELGDFSCDQGIALFMDIEKAIEDPMHLSHLWDIAQTLSEDLGAKMCEDNMQPISQTFPADWQNKLAHLTPHLETSPE